MTAEEFWEKVEKIYSAQKSGGATDVEFFIADASAVMDEWDETKHEYKL